MTRTETDTFRTACPCGAGYVEKTVVSTDYVFPSGNVSYVFECATCKPIWRLANGALVLRESEAPYITASNEARAAFRELMRAARQVVKEYCDAIDFPTKRAEHDHLREIGLNTKTYQTYLKWRREGKAMHDTIDAHHHLPWVIAIAAKFGKQQLLNQLIATRQAKQSNAEQAEKLIIRRSI